MVNQQISHRLSAGIADSSSLMSPLGGTLILSCSPALDRDWVLEETINDHTMLTA